MFIISISWPAILFYFMTFEIIDKNCFFKRAYCNVKVKMSTLTKYTPHGIKIFGIQTQEKYVFKYNYEV